MMMTLVSLGIDFGTSNTCAQYYEDGELRVVQLDGERIASTCITVQNGELYFGNTAKRYSTRQDTLYFPYMKIIIGRMRNNMKAYSRVQVPYELTEDAFPNIIIKRSGQIVAIISPQYIIALYLWNFARMDKQLRNEQVGTVLTIPATYNASQIHAFREAAELAGLKVSGIIPEPIGAALRYSQGINRFRYIVVYDLGGGTFDVSVVRHDDNDEYVILNSDGDPCIGGVRFDFELYEDISSKLDEGNRRDEVIEEFQRQREIPNERLKHAHSIEVIKQTLSDYSHAEFSLEDFGDEEGIDITREEFEKCIREYIEKTTTIVKRCLEKAEVKLTEADGIVLVGGSSRIPLVEELLREKFPQASISKAVDVNEVVSQGACLRACQEKARDNRKYFPGLQATARMFTPYQVYYSFDNTSTTLLVDEHISYDRILQTAVNIPAANATMHLWQMMNVEDPNTGEEKLSYVWFGDVDLSNYAGQTIDLRIEFDKCGEMQLSTNSIELPIRYGCVMTSDEKKKFRCLTHVLSKVKEGLDVVNEMDNPPADAEDRFLEIKKQAVNQLFKHVAKVDGHVIYWNDDLQRRFDGIIQEMDNYITQLKTLVPE